MQVEEMASRDQQPAWDIAVKVGDLTTEPVDAIVVSILYPGWCGHLSRFVFACAGNMKDAESYFERHKQEPLSVAHFPGGALPCKYIITVCLYKNDDGWLAAGVFNAVNLAHKLNCRSLAIPTLSCGGLGMYPAQSARETVEALRRFWAYFHDATPLQTICVLVHETRNFHSFKSAFQSLASQFTETKNDSGVAGLVPTLHSRQMVVVPYSRTLFIGDSGAGKSSLCNSIVGDPMVVNGDSTAGAELTMVACSVEEDGRWHKQLREEFIQRLAELMQGLASANTTHRQQDGAVGITRPSVSSSARVTVSGAAQREHHNPAGLKPTLLLPSMPSHTNGSVFRAIEDVTAKVRSAEYLGKLKQKIASGTFRIVTLWDLAGQDIYRSLQYIFFGVNNTTYVIVYDASQPVVVIAPVASVRRAGVSVSLSSPCPGQTSLVHIHDWLNVLSHMPGSEQCSVYIVGCKKDLRSGGEEELQKDHHAIMRSLKGKRYEKMVRAVFFVDNTRSGTAAKEDAGVVALRKLLSQESMAVEEVELRWLLYTLALQELSQTLTAPWLSVGDAVHLALSVCGGDGWDTKTFQDLCRHQTSLGHILYFPDSPALRDNIVIHIEGILQIISALMRPGLSTTDYTFGDQPDNDDIILYRKGFLTADLLEFLWWHHAPAKYWVLLQETEHRNFMLRLMQEMNVLCDVGMVDIQGNGNLRPMFLMPAAAEQREGIEVTGTLSPSMLLCCQSSLHFPQSLLLQLAVCCVSQHNYTSQHGWSLTGIQLFKTAVRVPWRPLSGTWLVLRYLKLGISVQLEVIGKSAMKAAQVPGHGRDAIAFIRESLSKVQKFCQQALVCVESVACPCSELKLSTDAIESSSKDKSPAVASATATSSTSSRAGAFCTVHGSETCCDHGDSGGDITASTCFHNVVGLQPGCAPRCPISGREQDVGTVISFWKGWKQDDCYVLHDGRVSPEQASSDGDSQTPSQECRAYSASIRRHFDMLSRRVRGKELARRMWTRGLLDIRVVEEVEAVHCNKGKTTANEVFLTALLKCTGDEVCCLVDDIMPHCDWLQEDIRNTIKTCPGKTCGVPASASH